MCEKLKAYTISCPDDDHGSTVRFATTANKARQHHDREQCDCPYIELRAVRAPELDQYSPGPVSFRTLVENHDWHVFCSFCGTSLYSDQAIVWDGDRAYCPEHAPAKSPEGK